MQFRLITDRQQGIIAFTDLQRSFATGAQRFPNHKVGWPSGSGRFDVYWHPDLRIWGVFEPTPSKEGRRFWICLGVDDPEEFSMLNIIVETNPPHEGVDRFVGGAFVQDDQDYMYLAHSGKVGGGRKASDPKRFSPSIAEVSEYLSRRGMRR